MVEFLHGLQLELDHLHSTLLCLYLLIDHLLGCVFVWLMVTKLWSLVFDILYMHNMQSYRVGDLLNLVL